LRAVSTGLAAETARLVHGVSRTWDSPPGFLLGVAKTLDASEGQSVAWAHPGYAGRNLRLNAGSYLPDGLIASKLLIPCSDWE